MERGRCWLLVICLAVGLGACDCSDDSVSGDYEGDTDIGDDAEMDATADGDGGGELDVTSDIDAGGEPFEDDACGLYQAECDGQCIPVSMDPENCGGCDIVCGENEVCSGGQCVDEGSCPDGLTACDGQCVDRIYDSDHCGLCGNDCDEGQGCAGGTCVDKIELGDDPEFCEGGGPVIEFGEQAPSPESCAGDLAESTFRWGLCGCDGVITVDPATIDAYDSSIGPYTPGGLGGGLGTNGRLIGDSAVSVTGTLWAQGEDLMPLDEEFDTVGVFTDDVLTIDQRLQTGADLINGEDAFVGEDAYIAGDIEMEDHLLEVGGTLYVTPDSEVNATVSAQDTEELNFDVGPACSFCAPDEAIDVAGLVEAYQGSANDNELIGLDPGVLSGSSGNVRLELPCGHYYLDEINTDGPATIVAKGHTVLYIGGDIEANNELTITLEPEARFDVFVAGSFETNNPFRLGSPNYPGLMRMYIGGEDGFVTNNEIRVGGYIYAVPGGITTNNEIEIYGGLHGQHFSSNNAIDIHYDRRITTVGRDCPDDDSDDPQETDAGVDVESDVDGGDDPEPVCSSTDESCVVDTDCCAPLTCNDGVCGLLSCSADFEPCSDHSDCCSGACTATSSDDGVCVSG